MKSELKMSGSVESIFTDDPFYHSGFFFDSEVLFNLVASVWRCVCVCVVYVCVSMWVFVFI